MLPPQLPLALRLAPEADFATYWEGPNAQPVAALRRAARGEGERLVYLHGPPGSGKSHLLQAACRAATEAGRGALWLPLAELADGGPAVLAGLETVPLVCLDGMEAVAGQAAWERALVALAAAAAAQGAGATLVLAARAAPGALPVALPDLRSRLGWGLVLRLRPLDDAGRAAALRLRAAARGFELPEETAAYLLRRCPRDPASLFALLDRLDRASLAARRRLTIPFVRGLLERA